MLPMHQLCTNEALCEYESALNDTSRDAESGASTMNSVAVVEVKLLWFDVKERINRRRRRRGRGRKRNNNNNAPQYGTQASVSPL